MRIAFVGFMGAGKTSYGKKIAQLLNLDFIDLDTYIEQKHKSSISYIFELVGQDGFRKIENKILQEVLEKDNYVLSVGGGTPCFFDNMELLNDKTTTVFLKVSAEKLAERLKNRRGRRPLLQGLSDDEFKLFVQSELIQRNKFYNKANIIIEAENINPQFIIEKINDFDNGGAIGTDKMA